MPVAPWEAALGAKVPVATFDDVLHVTLPPGTSSGRRLRLRGKGMPRRDGTRGDLYGKVKIVVPPSLDDEERRLFEELAKKSKFDPRAGRSS